MNIARRLSKARAQTLNTVLFILVFAVVIAISIYVYQPRLAEKKIFTQTLPSKRRASAVSKISGKVLGSNLRNSTVVISADKGAFVIISVDKNTLLTQKGKNIKLAKLKKGDVITVTYERKNIPASISVKSRK